MIQIGCQKGLNFYQIKYLRNNSEIVDLFIFSKCKFNILSKAPFHGGVHG